MKTSSQVEVRELLARVGQGEHLAFQKLYEATHLKMRLTALMVLRNREDAEEVVQDAYLKIWLHASNYRSLETLSPISWMAKIVRNRAIDIYRARRPSTEEVSPDFQDEKPDPEQSTIASQRDRDVTRMIARLDERKRAAIIGAYVDGLPYELVSAQTGAPLNTVRTRLRRGLQELAVMGATG